MFSAKLLDVLCLINKKNFSVLLINMKRLRGKILSVRWQEIVNCTTIMCKFDSSNKKQIHDFHKDRGNCYLDLLTKQIKLLRMK